MPLTNIHSLNESRAWGLWNIQEELSALEKNYIFASHEKEHLASISHPHKKQEWLASRLTVGLVCEHLQLPYAGTQKMPDKRPYLCEQNGHVSISHSHEYAAAIIDKNKPVGIDIERIDQKILAIRKKFLFEEEFSEDVRHMTQYWCIKETGYKLAGEKGLSLKDDIIVDPFSSGLAKGTTNIHIGDLTYKIEFFEHDNYILAFNTN
ncbi:MAG: 4'-phosphopantetheinyl transferase family protein [Cytophaga sp.]|uniref:4'-phosphopantetheinyl transferase family protein n=1 Tax=Cytophaga sp. TaxID=29535 RepID=UPI003F7F7C93